MISINLEKTCYASVFVFFFAFLFFVAVVFLFLFLLEEQLPCKCMYPFHTGGTAAMYIKRFTWKTAAE